MAKKEKYPAGYSVDADELIQVTKGKQLRDIAHCYHIEVSCHPGVPTKIPIDTMGPHMKLRVLDWIKAGRIYIDK
jgi:hypothetical protein